MAVAMLATSLAFAFYLYPGPDALADVVLSSDQPQLNKDEIPSADAVEAIRTHYRRAWLTNLLLLVCGVVGAVSWLSSRSYRGLKAWIGMLSLSAFLAVFLLVVIPETSASMSLWLPEKVAAIRKFAAIHAWSFVVAEVHRVVSFALAAVALGVMLAAVVRGTRQQGPQ